MSLERIEVEMSIQGFEKHGNDHAHSFIHTWSLDTVKRIYLNVIVQPDNIRYLLISHNPDHYMSTNNVDEFMAHVYEKVLA